MVKAPFINYQSFDEFMSLTSPEELIIDPPVQRFTQEDKTRLEARIKHYESMMAIHNQVLQMRKKQEELNNPDDPLDQEKIVELLSLGINEVIKHL